MHFATGVGHFTAVRPFADVFSLSVTSDAGLCLLGLAALYLLFAVFMWRPASAAGLLHDCRASSERLELEPYTMFAEF